MEEVKRIGFSKMSKKLVWLLMAIGVAIIFSVDYLGNLLWVPEKELMVIPLTVMLISSAIFVSFFHELAHGICYQLLGGKPTYGFKLKTSLGPVFYTSCKGTLIKIKEAVFAAIAPQILSALLLILSFVFRENSLVSNTLLMNAAFNLAGGVGDYYLIWYLLRLGNANYMIQDLGENFVLYIDKTQSLG